jgi:GxxExxY protein
MGPPLPDPSSASTLGAAEVDVEDELNRLTERIIGCAIEVHRVLGPGLLESAYEEALCVELDEARLHYRRQVAVPIVYKGRALGEYRLDLLVEDAVVVEVKSTERDDPVFTSQVLTYMRLTEKRLGCSSTSTVGC